MIVLIIRGVTLPGSWKGVEFLFTPNVENFTGYTYIYYGFLLLLALAWRGAR